MKRHLSALVKRYLSVLVQLAALLQASVLLGGVWFNLWRNKGWPGGPAWLGPSGERDGMADALFIISFVFLLAIWILIRIVLPLSSSVLRQLALLLLAAFSLGGIWWSLWMNDGWPGGADLLAKWLGADGEGAYDAMENEMSITCFVFLLAVWILMRIVLPRGSSVPG